MEDSKSDVPGFRRAALEDFLEERDGSPPPVFVGREDILGEIERVAVRTWKGAGAPAHGMAKATTVIRGAPGAGKSAVLDELKERAVERDGASGQSRIVTVESQDLVDDLPTVIDLIGVAGGLPERKWRDISSSLSTGLDLKAFKAEMRKTWSAPDNARPKSLVQLAETAPAARWQGPVVLCVDEAQRIPGDEATAHARFLQTFHGSRSGLPLSLVLAGLGDTMKRAKAMHLTRLEARECMALTCRGQDSEVAFLMGRFCRKFGVDPTGFEAHLDALAAPCEGWPRHLHFMLRALGRGLCESGGDLERTNWANVEAEAAESRKTYYKGQKSYEMKDADILVARVMDGLEDGMSQRMVKSLVRRSVDDRDGCRLPGNMDIDGFFDHLVHQGVLHERADETFHCPIPSFRTHLVHADGLDPDGRSAEKTADSLPTP